MALSYYIYYRVDPARSAAAEKAVRELLAAMRNATGVAGRLMRKRGEPNLWMEVYEGVADDAAFERELADAAGRLEFGDFLQPGSGRRIECFLEP